MLILKIALGLFGLGIVVFVHELGHFLAARLVGIDVEAFSIGWGNPILKKKIGKTEYRLGMFPIGGYCKMRGENEFQEAWENNASGVEPVKGTFFGASPLGRILVSFAGPFFNVLFAVLVMSIIWGLGREIYTRDNRIVMASELSSDRYPADEAGFKTGDRIIEINGKKTNYAHEVQEIIVTNPKKLLSVTVEREGRTEKLDIRPTLDRDTGAGRIGVFFWTDPVVAGLVPDGNAAIAGLLPGDRIVRVDGETITHIYDVEKILKANSGVAVIDYVRNGIEHKTEIVLSRSEGDGLGIIWPWVQYQTPALSPPAAVAKGVSESWKTLVVSLKSLGLLKDIDLTKAVSGPVRITYMVGDIAAEGFDQSFAAGLRSMAEFLALISVALCVMNLLPLPILDGGLIILSIVEMIRRKPIHPKALRAFQTVGVVLIFGLMAFAVFGDIQYLARR
jgi:regulator of sigma E protease